MADNGNTTDRARTNPSPIFLRSFEDVFGIVLPNFIEITGGRTPDGREIIFTGEKDA